MSFMTKVTTKFIITLVRENSYYTPVDVVERYISVPNLLPAGMPMSRSSISISAVERTSWMGS